MTEPQFFERRREWLNAQLALADKTDICLARNTRFAVGQIRAWIVGSSPISATALRELAAAIGVEPPAELVGN